MAALRGVVDFDGIAGAYRWMEYASVGPMLERVRWWWLDRGELDGARYALVLGDGDGRFTRRLLLKNQQVRVTAVDLSGKMLRLLERRCRVDSERLRTVQRDVRGEIPERGMDLVVTHFLLDCLADDEVEALVRRVRASLRPGANWVVSEFAIPSGMLRYPARLLVRGLYFVFYMLTGLQVSQLPDHADALRRCGFSAIGKRAFWGGLLVTELWRLEPEAKSPKSQLSGAR